MDGPSAEDLPLVQRLALAYATPSARENILTLLLLDARLAAILRQRGEVLIAQVKLAWWRDRLREDPGAWPIGEPLLRRLARWPASPAMLVPLVDGWEALLADELSEAAIDEFAQGRGLAWRALAGAGERAPDALRAARHWALADLALHLRDGEERARTLAMLENEASEAIRIPRTLRPLAVLRGLSLRAARRGSAEPLDGPGAILAALRIGLSGR